MEWLEVADDPDDVLGYGVDSDGDFASPYSLWRMGDIGEAYEGGDAACLLHVELEASGLHPQTQNLCIGYQKMPKGAGSSATISPPASLKTSKTPKIAIPLNRTGFTNLCLSSLVSFWSRRKG